MAEHEFKPMEWVLVRDTDNECWRLNIFSHKGGEFMGYICVSSFWKQCIPYEGNEGLLGKCDASEEKRPYDFSVGDIVEVMNERDGKWYPGKILLIQGVTMPYFVQSEFGFKDCAKLTSCSWCSKDQLRNLGETPEPKEEEEFKFGDKVEALFAGEWCEALIIEIDHSVIPYKIATANGDVHWVTKSRVRRA